MAVNVFSSASNNTPTLPIIKFNQLYT